MNDLSSIANSVSGLRNSLYNSKVETLTIENTYTALQAGSNITVDFSTSAYPYIYVDRAVYGYTYKINDSEDTNYIEYPMSVAKIGDGQDIDVKEKDYMMLPPNTYSITLSLPTNIDIPEGASLLDSYISYRFTYQIRN